MKYIRTNDNIYEVANIGYCRFVYFTKDGSQIYDKYVISESDNLEELIDCYIKLNKETKEVEVLKNIDSNEYDANYEIFGAIQYMNEKGQLILKSVGKFNVGFELII